MRHLSDHEVFYIRELLHGRQVNRGEGIVISAEEVLGLQRVFDHEVKARKQRIPQDWRDKASDFLVEKGAYKLAPGIAGGRIVSEKEKPSRLKVDDVDQLLMLVGDPSELIPEE